jgi:hypothetical protein
MLGEIEKMKASGPTEAEVADAIANIAGSYALRYESAADVASALLAAELHGYGEEYLENYGVRVGQVDVAAARAAAAEILDTTAFVIVLVGDASAIEPQLKQAGWRYDKVDFRAPIGTIPYEPPPVDPKAEQAARKLLDEALAAKGKKIASMKALKMSAKGEMVQQGQALPITIERVYVAPDKMRVDLTIALSADFQIQISYALDGDKGWSRSPDQNGQMVLADIDPSQLSVLREQRWHDPEFIMMRHTEKGTKVVPLPDEVVDGKTCAVINLSSADGTSTATVFVDKKTKLLVQLAYPENGQVTLDTFDDYKDVSGVKVAHKRKSGSGQDVATLEVTAVEIDGKVDAKLFAKPAQ